jgi:glc operon protein GlcG
MRLGRLDRRHRQSRRRQRRGKIKPAEWLPDPGHDGRTGASELHAAIGRHPRRRLLFGELGDHRIGGDEKTGDRGRILQGGAHDLGRADDPGPQLVAAWRCHQLSNRWQAEFVLTGSRGGPGMAVTLAEAHRIMEGAIAKARELKAEISVTVCDANGRLVALNRMDGALAEANHFSIGKAIVSAASGRPSGEAETAIDFSLRTGTVVGEGMPLIRRQGGLPIMRRGVLEGACGVSGASNKEEDERCARAGIEQVSAGSDL